MSQVDFILIYNFIFLILSLLNGTQSHIVNLSLFNITWVSMIKGKILQQGNKIPQIMPPHKIIHILEIFVVFPLFLIFFLCGLPNICRCIQVRKIYTCSYSILFTRSKKIFLVLKNYLSMLYNDFESINKVIHCAYFTHKNVLSCVNTNSIIHIHITKNSESYL